MDKRPKRRRYKDNPYEIDRDSINNKYFIKFKDSQKKLQIIEINQSIYKVFNEFELKDLSEMNEYDNHIEYSTLIESTLYKRAATIQKSVYEQVEENILHDNLKKAIDLLPTIQKRRLKMYFFEDMTLQEIALKEQCSKSAVKHSIDDGLSNLKKNLKI